MALDGAFLRHLKKEITDRALGARVDKNLPAEQRGAGIFAADPAGGV